MEGVGPANSGERVKITHFPTSVRTYENGLAGSEMGRFRKFKEENEMLVTLRPYVTETKTEAMSPFVKRYLDGEFAEKAGAFSVRVENDHRDTGHGLDYLNNLIIEESGKTVFETGWR